MNNLQGVTPNDSDTFDQENATLGNSNLMYTIILIKF